ncbi:putative mycolyltransferase [Gordonia araii NBRC 100433]|uniref:Putative mycolyltransferase n=1 Tax=Gordonia araii NBRC 100433 TaxID=1073574 RepID=G7H766_9ACTN|nr:alpha/beta hydrolase family protein [Gordonia araii]NNG97687.1 esterase family protein [Gordonia araii NBRC 100433]GAB11691.1 putative mycolyltransferase [Gordonia araii NBRC 100433]
MGLRKGPRHAVLSRSAIGAAAIAALSVGLVLAVPQVANPDLIIKPVAKPSKIDSVVPGADRQVTAVVYSASMNRQIPVTVLKPKDESKPAPVLYLLNGAGGGEDSATWAEKTDYQHFFQSKNVYVVTPVGGAFSYYTDWQRDDPVLGRNKWETFLTKELPPLINKEFKTTKANALAGISMAGTSVLNLAIAAPKLYRSVAAYSGCARTSDPLGQAYIRMVVGDRGRGNVVNMWGPIGGPGWMANDPYQNAARLRGTRVYMTTGTGLPGRQDTMGAPLVNDDPIALANQVVVGGLIESAVNLCTQQMAQRMRELRIPAKVITRPTGTHSWGYWEADLKRTWPMIARDIGVRR